MYIYKEQCGVAMQFKHRPTAANIDRSNVLYKGDSVRKFHFDIASDYKIFTFIAQIRMWNIFLLKSL